MTRSLQRARLRQDPAEAYGEQVSEHTPTYGLDRWIARRRREMGEARWQQLNDEWNASQGAGAANNCPGSTPNSEDHHDQAR